MRFQRILNSAFAKNIRCLSHWELSNSLPLYKLGTSWTSPFIFVGFCCWYRWIRGRTTCWFVVIHEDLKSVKVEKILKGSLDSILSPSPSVKIQIMGGKVCLRCQGKTFLGIVNKLLKTKSLLASPSNVNVNVNFPANNLNFYWRWR